MKKKYDIEKIIEEVKQYIKENMGEFENEKLMGTDDGKTVGN